MDNNHEYDDIINMKHYSSPNRPRMSRVKRAAQFAPFAALTGYDAAVAETARLTDKKHELTEDESIIISIQLQILSENADSKPEVTITHFVPDSRKNGGAYEKNMGNVKRVNKEEMKVIFTNGTAIDISDICRIEGEIFDDFMPT